MSKRVNSAVFANLLLLEIEIPTDLHRARYMLYSKLVYNTFQTAVAANAANWGTAATAAAAAAAQWRWAPQVSSDLIED